MSAFPTDYILDRYGGVEAVDLQSKSAKVWLAKTILRQIAEGDLSAKEVPTDSDFIEMQKTVQIVELRALDLMQDWRRDSTSKEGIEFRKMCSFAFDVRRAMPISDNSEGSLKNDVMLACVAVLGDRTADIRRHFKEHPWIIPKPEENNWGQELFYKTSDAFLRVVRKQEWKDLESVAETISRLRKLQKSMESEYLTSENSVRQAAALELIAFYHLAKSIEVLGLFVGNGEPSTASDEVEFHISRAIRSADSAGVTELAILLRWIGAASRMLIRTTIWHQLSAYNSSITSFKKILTDRSRTQPMFELLPPQREAVQDLMSIGNRAVVVEMPTSSGKTLLAQFRIIQTKVNVADSWIAYLVPTKALVNQLASRLRRDLGQMGLKVEIASPAIEVDVFEDEILKGEDTVDVLVTTPEKLDLLIRSNHIDLKHRTLGLVILDEAHNIGEGERGLRAELLLANINRESPDTHFLLLTPFVPNAEELAKWLDAERSKAIKPVLSVDWQPNDRLIGLAYLEGKGKNWGINVRALHTSNPSIYFEDEVVLETNKVRDVTISKARTSQKKISAEIARVLSFRGCSIVLAYSPSDTWNIADYIAKQLDSTNNSNPKIELVRRHVEDEYGENFPLVSLLKKGVGVHHAGLSPETRYLLEWLVENNELKTLVATSTLAQGVNFPISNVVLATHHKPVKTGKDFIKKPLKPQEFWNIAGRAGRLFHDTLGIVVFASRKTHNEDIERYVNSGVEHLASALEEMISDTLEKGWELDLKSLVKNDVKWSSFVQFLSHTYLQINDHSKFMADTEMLLKRTYAYRRLMEHDPETAEQLVDSTRIYAEQLREMPSGVISLVDTTGFSPETVMSLLNKKEELKMTIDEWSPSNLFKMGGEGLKGLVGKMIEINELDIEGRGRGEEGSIAEIINMWVAGKSLKEIAVNQRYFFDDYNEEKKITECCRLLFQKLTQSGSWGLGAIQNISDIDFESLPPDQREIINTLPAMIYYGCSTVEGVLMRSLNVPRSICVSLGESFKVSKLAKSEDDARLSIARKWLGDASIDEWDKAASESKLSGKDHKNVWLILNGNEPEID